MLRPKSEESMNRETTNRTPHEPHVSDAQYEPPKIHVLGQLSEQTLGKRGSLTDGIHIQRLGGSIIHNSSA